GLRGARARDLPRRVVYRPAAEGREWRRLAPAYSAIICCHSNDRPEPRLLAAMRCSECCRVWNPKRVPRNPNNTHHGAATNVSSLTSIQKATGLSLCTKRRKIDVSSRLNPTRYLTAATQSRTRGQTTYAAFQCHPARD